MENLLDLSEYTRKKATRVAKANNLKAYIWKGRVIAPDGPSPKAQWRDNEARNKRYWRIDPETGLPGRQLDSQLRREESRIADKNRFRKPTKQELEELALGKKLASEQGLDYDHVAGQSYYSIGDINAPSNRAGLDPALNRGPKKLEELALSQQLLETELKNPSASMPLEETLDLASHKPHYYENSIYRHIGREETRSVGAAGRFGNLASSSGEGRPFWNEIEETLSKPYDINDPFSQGIWHGFDDQGDPWVKISRELNEDSGKFDDATGKFTYTKDPTARTDIDILSDIGEGKGNYGEILKLKNQFHDLKRSLPPGEYYLHADDPTKAKYYQRAFANDPWIGPSGEKGGGRLRSKVPGQKGEYVEYETLKLTVPEAPDQFTEALAGKTPWQAQGVPRTDLSKDVMLKAKQYGLQMSDVSDLSKAMRKAGSILPFVGAGLDAWDVQQRWEEAMNNPNKGLADWLDKVQLGLATTTLGTSFWAEPANFALGMTNLGIDVARTFAEEDKREDFFRTMRAVGREGTRIARMAL